MRRRIFSGKILLLMLIGIVAIVGGVLLLSDAKKAQPIDNKPFTKESLSNSSYAIRSRSLPTTPPCTAADEPEAIAPAAELPKQDTLVVSDGKYVLAHR
jgi:hypothetical protein